MSTAVAPPETPAVTVTASGRWRGVLGLMDAWSADQRMLMAPQDGEPVRARPLPLPLLVQPELAPGHDGGKLGVGVMDRVWTENGFVMGEGRFDMADPDGAKLARKVGEGFIRFVSLDVDDATAHQVCLAPDGETILDDCPMDNPNAMTGMVYTGWRIMGATLLAHPAFPDAHIALADDTTDHTAQAAVRLADSPTPVSDDTDDEIVGYNPAWGCVAPNDDGSAWTPADCAADGAVPANPTGDGPYDPEEVVEDADETPDVPEEEVTDEGTGCVVPDPDNEDGWLQVDCSTPGAVPANEDGTGPMDEVTEAANAADAASMAITSWAVDVNLPWAPRDRAWDGDQARRNVAGWATTGEGENATLDPARMTRAFLIVDGPEENQGSYKYGVADMVDGELKLVWNGVTAANAALHGARGAGPVPGREEALKDVRTLYGKAAEAFDDPSIEDNEGAMAAQRYAVPLLADTAPPEDGTADPADPESKDQGNGCVCEQEDGTYAPCDCALDDAETADADGNPVDDDPDDVELSTVPADCEPCKGVAITASAATDMAAAPGFNPPSAWFDQPQFTGPQPITVDPDTGRLMGHLAAWGTCHVGFRDRCVTPPRSASGYGFFHTARIPTSGGPLDVGIITMDTGHAPLEMTAASSVSHYDNTGTQAAVCRVGEDQYGIWVAGVTLPFVSAEERLRLSLASFSGDWRHIRGGAELVAALAVNTPGFPMPARRTGTDNAEYALVAAGALPRAVPAVPARAPKTATATVTVDAGEVARIVLGELDAREQRAARARQVTAKFRNLQATRSGQRLGRVAASVQALADELAADRVALARTKVTGLDIEIPKGVRALKSDVAFMETRAYANWVEQQGGLPRKIKSVARHLQDKGMGQSQAIAVAVNVAKKACASGDSNWPGRQQINAKSRAEYCAAVARWEEMKAAARAS
jgi:hypothetical protein